VVTPSRRLRDSMLPECVGVLMQAPGATCDRLLFESSRSARLVRRMLLAVGFQVTMEAPLGKVARSAGQPRQWVLVSPADECVFALDARDAVAHFIMVGSTSVEEFCTNGGDFAILEGFMGLVTKFGAVVHGCTGLVFDTFQHAQAGREWVKSHIDDGTGKVRVYTGIPDWVRT
jgi:hypothetical protein